MRAGKSFTPATTLLAAAILLSACSHSGTSKPTPTSLSPPPALTAPYAAAAANGAHVYRLDPGASQVLIFVGKTGPLADLGHEHVIRVGALRGFVMIAKKGNGRADLVFPVKALSVDPPATLESLGKPWSDHQPGRDARRGTRHNMLGPNVLAARRYPWVHLGVHATSPHKRRQAVTITLHGVSRKASTHAHPRVAKQTIKVHGRFTIKQTDFAMTPYTALLGALRVKNRIEIRYRLTFSRWKPKAATTP